MQNFKFSGVTVVAVQLFNKINPLGTVIEIRNLTACAMLVINCVQADTNEPFAFVVAHCCFTAREGDPSLVSRCFPTTLGKIESETVLWDLPE